MEFFIRTYIYLHMHCTITIGRGNDRFFFVNHIYEVKLCWYIYLAFPILFWAIFSFLELVNAILIKSQLGTVVACPPPPFTPKSLTSYLLLKTHFASRPGFGSATDSFLASANLKLAIWNLTKDELSIRSMTRDTDKFVIKTEGKNYLHGVKIYHKETNLWIKYIL